MSLDHVSFRAGDPAEIEFDRPFDAVLGRYVLQFQNDPASFLRRLAAHVRPGGIVVFHELDWGGCASVPSSPVFDRLCRWGVETLRRHGTEPRMGVKLHATFIAAGLGPPQMRLEAPVTGGPEPTALKLLTDFVPTILPEMERLGVATSVEVGPDDLFERMASDGMANGSVFVLFHQWGAWASVGDGSRAPEA
jgi:SAM-dependent methyltransferase